MRHGQAAAGWGEDVDPGLSDEGRRQAEAMAVELAPLGPLPILVSPLRRTRETAAPLERAWGTTAVVEPAVGEVLSPTDDLAERMAWLAQLLSRGWDDWPEELMAWRNAVADRLLAIQGDTVVVTHFVAIGSVVQQPGYHPDYCSITRIDNRGNKLSVVELGRSAKTVVR